MAQGLLVVGAGPKALAIAVKASALRALGFSAPNVIIIEKNKVAANWAGAFGYTDGRQVLGTPPQKDVGFPYSSKVFTRDVDVYVFNHFSWPVFNVQRWSRYSESLDIYGDEVDRGVDRHTVHSDWAAYLTWVSERVDARIITGEVVSIDAVGGRWNLGVSSPGSNTQLIDGDGLVFTGPVPLCTPLGCSTKHCNLGMFDGNQFSGGLVLLRHQRRSRGVYWSIFAPALIEPP